MKASVLKPGLLVSLHSSVRGGVSYSVTTLEADRLNQEEGSRSARWETHRHIPDAAEFERATQARGKARALVAGVCCTSAFGLLCPEEKEGELAEAIKAARGVADEFNETAKLSRVEVFALVGRVARDDEEAARAIASEVRGLLEDMQAGIAAANPDAIREAANKARAVGGMLAPEVGEKVNKAIEQARAAARALVKRVEKAGEKAADVVAQCNVEAIKAARFAFLDLTGGEAGEALAVPGRAVELDAEAPGVQASSVEQRALELA